MSFEILVALVVFAAVTSVTPGPNNLMLLTSGGWVEELTGSALVAGDARQAIVRATLAAANRRLDSLLP